MAVRRQSVSYCRCIFFTRLQSLEDDSMFSREIEENQDKRKTT